MKLPVSRSQCSGRERHSEDLGMSRKLAPYEVTRLAWVGILVTDSSLALGMRFLFKW